MRSPRDERAQAILAAARDLFSRQGYHGTSMPEIARAADVSVGLIYHIFASKEEILAAIVEDTHAVHLEVFDECAGIADPLERFDAVVRGLYTTMDRSSRLLIILYRDLSAIDREARRRILMYERETAEHIAALIGEGQRAGVFRREIPAVELLSTNIVGLGHQWALKKTWLFGPHLGLDLEGYIAAQLAYLHALLLPDERDAQGHRSGENGRDVTRQARGAGGTPALHSPAGVGRRESERG
jgi:AcrR family transcriptional regulator